MLLYGILSLRRNVGGDDLAFKTVVACRVYLLDLARVGNVIPRCDTD